MGDFPEQSCDVKSDNLETNLVWTGLFYFLHFFAFLQFLDLSRNYSGVLYPHKLWVNVLKCCKIIPVEKSWLQKKSSLWWRSQSCLPDLKYTSKSDKHFSFYNNDKMILLVTCRFGLKAHTHRHQVAFRRYVMFSRLCKYNLTVWNLSQLVTEKTWCHLAAGARSLRITGFITTLSKMMCCMSLFYCAADCHYAKSHGANKTIYHLRRHGQELDGRFSPTKVVGSDLSWPQCYKTFYGRNLRVFALS